MWCRSFAAIHGIVKISMLLETPKCTDSIGEHVSEFASMSAMWHAAATSCRFSMENH